MKGVEQRRYRRVPSPKGLVVAWQSGTRRAVSNLETLAMGGMFVLTGQAIPLRSMVRVLFDLPIGEVRARAVVRWVIPQRGMGIEFIAMDQEDRARLGRMLMPLLASSAGTE